MSDNNVKASSECSYSIVIVECAILFRQCSGVGSGGGGPWAPPHFYIASYTSAMLCITQGYNKFFSFAISHVESVLFIPYSIVLYNIIPDLEHEIDLNEHSKYYSDGDFINMYQTTSGEI